MTQQTVPADTGRTNAGPRRTRPEPTPYDVAAALLRELEQAIDTTLGSLLAAMEPPLPAAVLLAEAREHLEALYLGVDGVRLPPKEQQKRRELLGQKLEGLEDVLEALELATRTGRAAGGV
jgi:hypothetical protein